MTSKAYLILRSGGARVSKDAPDTTPASLWPVISAGPTDARSRPAGAAARSGHGYRSASSRYRHGRAFAARSGDPRRDRADGWRRHGAAHGARAAPGRDPRPAPIPSAAGHSAGGSG